MTQQHPGAPRLKNNGPLCERNTDTTCPLFLPPPHSTSLSFYLPCSFVPSLTGREQGMLIKGWNPEEKKGGLIGTPRERYQAKNSMCQYGEVTRVEMEVRFVAKKQPGNEWLIKKMKKDFKKTTAAQGRLMFTRLGCGGWVGGWVSESVCVCGAPGMCVAV